MILRDNMKITKFAGYLIHHGGKVVNYSPSRVVAGQFCVQNNISIDSIEAVYSYADTDVSWDNTLPYNGLYEPDSTGVFKPVKESTEVVETQTN